MRDMTVKQLWAEAEKVCEWLKAERGYDNTEVLWISIHPESFTFELTYEDEFQREADRPMRYHSGAYQSVRIEADETLWSWAARIPTRRQRETAFIIRQLHPIASAAEQVKDLEIQEIVQGILGANTSLHNLLEDKSNAQQDAEDFPF